MMTNFTPIKNEILTEIIAKGRLSYRETRIASYVIRNSWGYSFNGSRQQWTKRLSVTRIAEDIGSSRCKCSMIINRMIKEKKLFKKGNQYQFNEHYEEWMLQKDRSVNKSEQLVLTKMNSSIAKKVTVVLAKVNSSVTKRVTTALPKG